MSEVALWDEAKSLVAQVREAVNIPQTVQAEKAADLIAAYARLQGDKDLECWCAEIRVLAKRRMGELIAKLPRGSGRNLPNVAPSGLLDKRQVLAQVGINKDEAHEAEKLARVDDLELSAYLDEQKRAGKVTTSASVVRALVRKTPKAVPTDPVFAAGLEGTELEDLFAARTRGIKFGTIYADPPWSYDNTSSNGAAENHYATMSLEELHALPIGELAADNAHLHLWATSPLLVDAIRLMETWGFNYKSSFVWVKPQLGMGNYWRVSHEFLLLGVRGSGSAFADKGLRSWGQFDRGRHSAKPEEVRAMIERGSAGPRLELFGRAPVERWAVWGNQAPRSEYQDALDRLAA